MAILNQSHDILFCILDLLPPPSLNSTSKLTKPIRSVTEARLYNSVTAAWAPASVPPPTALLLRTLLERPDLSRCVRHLRLVGDGFGHEVRVCEPPSFTLDSASLARASALISAMGVSFADMWISELQSGSIDAIVATLLVTMPNLETLYLDPNFTVRSRVLGSLFQSTLVETPDNRHHHQLPSFRNLRNVTFSRRFNEHLQLYINNSADLLPLFYLPNLQHLSISLDNPLCFDWPAEAPKAPSLKSLEVSRLREAALASLLAPLSQLQHLRWNCFYQPDLDEGISTNVIQLDLMIKAFHQVRHTLTDLTVTAETRRSIMAFYEPPPVQIRGSLDGLLHLGALRRLSMPWVFLMGFSESSTCLRLPLPSSLEELVLTDDLADKGQWQWYDDSIVSAIKSQLECWDRPTDSSLRRIVLPIPLQGGQMTAGRREQLREIGNDAGLELSWRE
ncbi:hypothetical protein CDD80_7599 [Ophiocordyceps camponoti-rufipedis]|uniref:Leucine-rich repeat domain-containing protein n=1 Tax=Ophiocordyceps camponoti-rufipedis TaxID=2004952 RepID=A0A2C5ZA76_9HYPO|nr:hypothetical protein CDD80_7599 [Ophiocordyceps camponoti-rufipedis]